MRVCLIGYARCGAAFRMVDRMPAMNSVLLSLISMLRRQKLEQSRMKWYENGLFGDGTDFDVVVLASDHR